MQLKSKLKKSSLQVVIQPNVVDMICFEQAVSQW